MSSFAVNYKYIHSLLYADVLFNVSAQRSSKYVLHVFNNRTVSSWWLIEWNFNAVSLSLCVLSMERRFLRQPVIWPWSWPEGWVWNSRKAAGTPCSTLVATAQRPQPHPALRTQFLHKVCSLTPLNHSSFPVSVIIHLISFFWLLSPCPVVKSQESQHVKG